MHSTRTISRFVAAFVAAVFHVVVLGSVGAPAWEAGVAFRDMN
ncbi:hypothetical protein [Streptomyces sp. NBC_01497]|nr:hypothetical protein [Streptomyces sp. NBC_01497]